MARVNWVLKSAEIDVEPILREAKKVETEKAELLEGEIDNYRLSDISWLSGNEILSDILDPYVQSASKILEVECLPMHEYQYTEYSVGGKYDWHHDVDWQSERNMDRKLSVTVQLSDATDYDGGFFEFDEVSPVPLSSREKGSILVFPSILGHRVTPVTRGKRKSLVAWYYGPKWR